MLDTHPRAQLCFILEQYGRVLINEPKRCRGMLKDLAPHHTRETNLLITALEQKVAEELLKPNPLISVDMQIERLAKRLHDNLGTQLEFAFWAVESWALALNIIQEPVPKQNDLAEDTYREAEKLCKQIEYEKASSERPSINPAGIPADFDQHGFLSGSEKAFRYLQAAWNNRDLASIRGLTTDKVFAEIQNQLRATNTANKTEVLQLKAELLEVRGAGSEMEATVLFDSLLRENDGREEAVREIWYFIKPVHSQQTKWFLDGIQQLEE
ncbi:Tim44-like domain-containing protein [Methylomonas sp. AM2-LC]|uniref:Tim44 domain-containing protein n=1 Tax=Methylomonas sp. AM2-LC TaxID=3153301 RepID=UPI003264F564